jgi:predicted nuclease with TOPRIM domain
MALGEQELKTIGEYVRNRLPEWLGSMNYYPRPDKYDLEIRDRMVRVEEELKNQRELMLRGFEQVDKRLDQIDKRFEQVDKHFDRVYKRFEAGDERFESFERRFERLDTKFNRLFALGVSGITVLAALLSLYQFLN